MVHQKLTRVLFTFALLAFFVLGACSDKALQTAAKASRDIAAANIALQSTIIQAQQQGTLTPDQIRPIVEVTVTVGQAGKQLDAAINGLNSLAPADKTKILAILQPVVASLANGVASTNLITNQTIKTTVMASLTAMQAALATLQGVLG
jgi:hypothetical protein